MDDYGSAECGTPGCHVIVCDDPGCDCDDHDCEVNTMAPPGGNGQGDGGDTGPMPEHGDPHVPMEDNGDPNE